MEEGYRGRWKSICRRRWKRPTSPDQPSSTHIFLTPTPPYLAFEHGVTAHTHIHTYTHTHTHMKKKEIVSLMGDGRMELREPCRSSLGTASLSVSVDRERGQNKGQHERALTLGGLMVGTP